MTARDPLRSTVPAWAVRPYTDRVHLPGCVSLARRVNAHDSAYPPPGTGATIADLSAWLRQPTVDRWVALDPTGSVVGHVGVSAPHQYLTRHLAARFDDPAGTLLEVGQLMVDPAVSGTGLGTTLLATACEAIWACGKTAALAVMESTPAAIHLYRKAGMISAGTFDGIHGRNYVFTAAP